jgi:hypothetical protein
MARALLIYFILVILIVAKVSAQDCTNLGQTPETAFPICGTSTFQQSNVPICSSIDLYVPGCSGTTGAANYQNKNPYWYRFTCYQTGTLGFILTPNNMGDDYDWQLYDITGHNPSDIFTDRSLVVTGNWSGSSGLTGAQSGGLNYIQCASAPSDNASTFSYMPTIIVGHEYILLISHYTDSQSGYGLSFQGGTAVITDPLEPHLATAVAACDGSVITVKLNKKIKCSSLARNASDFNLAPFAGTIISAVGTGCSGSFDMDELTLTLGTRLQPGNYTLTIKNGSDGNTLMDNCDRTIPVGESLNLTLLAVSPTPMDSITTPGCAPQTLEVVFHKNIRCRSLSPIGNEFTVTGPTPVTVTGVRLNCVNDLTQIVTIKLAAPIQTGGTYFLHLDIGNDGNTIIDECGEYTPDTTLAFIVKDTVSANFTYNINYGCTSNSVNYSHNGQNNVNTWAWNFGGAGTSLLQNPVITYTNFEPTTTKLIVSNGVCSDTNEVIINFDNLLNAQFEAPEFICPSENVNIINQTIGNVSLWEWSFGNGSISGLENPPAQLYITQDNTYTAIIKLTATNIYGCTDTASRTIKVINNCFIAVPSAFTPNGDGLNDYLYPLNAYKAIALQFTVYNRFGQKIFYSTNWTNKWDGNFKGQAADSGTYVWVLQYTNIDTGRRVEQKGTVLLIR